MTLSARVKAANRVFLYTEVTHGETAIQQA